MRFFYAFVVLVLCTGCNFRIPCGPQQPNLKIEGGVWMPDYFRAESKQVTDQCVTLLDAQETATSDTDIQLPKVDALGFVNVDVGKVKLTRTYAERYIKLSGDDKRFMTIAKLWCQGALERFACIQYSSMQWTPENYVSEQLGKWLKDVNDGRKEISDLWKKYSAASTDVERKALLAQIEAKLAATPVDPPDPRSLSTTDGSPAVPLSLDVIPAPTIAINLASLGLDVGERLQALDTKFNELDTKYNEKTSAAHETALQALGIARGAVEKLTACSDYTHKDRDAVIGERRSVANELNIAKLNIPEDEIKSYTRALRISINGEGFSGCQVDLPKDVRARVVALATVIGKRFAANPQQWRPIIVIHGYTDDSPPLNCPKDLNLNWVIATRRAEETAKILKDSSNVLKDAIVVPLPGSDPPVMCNQTDLAEVKKCQARNRRVTIDVESPALMHQPEDCLTQGS